MSMQCSHEIYSEGCIRESGISGWATDRLECTAASFVANGLIPICSMSRFGATNAVVHTRDDDDDDPLIQTRESSLRYQKV